MVTCMSRETTRSAVNAAGDVARRLQRASLAAVVLCAVAAIVSPACAADFDLQGPTVELRRVQFCAQCKKALLVTTIPPGARIQCPNCDTVQTRIPTQYLLTKVYQVCPRCGARMAVDRYGAGALIRCGTCGQHQQVLMDAVYAPPENAGTGWLPDMPKVPAEVLPSRPPPSGPAATQGPADGADFFGPELADEPAAHGLQSPRSSVAAGKMPSVSAPGLPPEFRPAPSLVGKPAAYVPTDDGPVGEVLPPTPEAYGVGPEDEEPPELDASLDELRVVATVNGEPIHAAALETSLQQALDQLRLQLGPAAASGKGRALVARRRDELRTKALEMLIDRRLLLQAAEREGIQPAIAEVAGLAQEMRRERTAAEPPAPLLEEARFELILRELAKRRMQAGVDATPEAVRAHYEAHQAEYMQPPRTILRGLVVFLDRRGRQDTRPAQEIAREIVDQLAQGVGFRDLVLRYSESPSREWGGVVQAGGSPAVPVALVAGPVQEALATARPGKVSGPLLLSTSVVFVLPEKLLPAAPLPLAEVSGGIQRRLTSQARRAAFDDWVTGLRQQAEIRRF